MLLLHMFMNDISLGFFVGCFNLFCLEKSTSIMSLNDNKAGMQGLDKERINQIIYEASKG